MPAEDFLRTATRECPRLKKLADDALAQMPAEGYFARAADVDNSIGIIVKHVGGNLRSRWTDFLTTDGEKPDRNRDGEFELGEGETRETILATWEAGWAALLGALAALGPGDMERTVTIRGEPFSVQQAITRSLSHTAYHVGQIVFLAKHFTGEEWKSLSIPLRKSDAFNAAPKKYLGT